MIRNVDRHGKSVPDHAGELLKKHLSQNENRSLQKKCKQRSDFQQMNDSIGVSYWTDVGEIVAGGGVAAGDQLPICAESGHRLHCSAIFGIPSFSFKIVLRNAEQCGNDSLHHRARIADSSQQPAETTFQTGIN